MKMLFPLLLSLLFVDFSFLKDTKVIRPDLEEDLIAYYSFNHCDARDESGNDSDGMLYGRTSCWCGVQGEGLQLNGQTDYIEFPGRINAAFNTTDFTISFYVKADQYSIFEQSLFSKRADCDSLYQMLDIRLDMRQREIITEVYEYPEKYYPGLTPETEGIGWVHYALVRNGTWAYTYVNGVLQNESRKCSGVDISNDAVLSFSNSPCVQNGKARRFKGILDELRVYEKALTEEEIWKLYMQNPIENANDDCLT
ncbi:MAG: LamG domain-containing protein [Saprospiraceae bacterium]